jgi:uncharacterized protein YegP (UPF0339 family)
MQLVIYKDNRGQFHWRLAGEDGVNVAVSAASFGTAGDAQDAAADVQQHAGTATTPDR